MAKTTEKERQRLGNEAYRAMAIRAEVARDYIACMRLYNTAAAYTLGHNKTDRYYWTRGEIARQYEVPETEDFATDEDITTYWDNWTESA